MMNEKVTSRSFSPAFQHICTIVAISEIRDQAETLRRLILHTFAELQGESLSDGHQVSATIDTLYGLQVPPSIAQECLDTLLKRGELQTGSSGAGFTIRPDLITAIQAKVAAAQSLEKTVRDDWLLQVGSQVTGLDLDCLWKSLQAYLFRAFRRHGLQAAALIDSSVDVAPEHAENLSLLLSEALEDHIPEKYRSQARTLIRDFLVDVGGSRQRCAYITQLADGAFSYFSLTVAPEAAAALREELRPLKLFLDTNFLFGVIRLGEHVWADLTQELVDIVRSDLLPFTLFYHQRTDREVNSTIQHYESYLSRDWSSGLARAALASRNISGVIRQFLESYLQTGTDARTFFRPFRHVDELLSQQGIELFSPGDQRLEDRATVLHDYRDFLESKNRAKGHNVVEHDATLLEAVRFIRSSGKSSLEAGALLLTYDYNLYRFEWQASRREGRPPCVVLPNIFWQMIRPYIPPDADFDRSFAETFALPEFRTLGSQSAEAASRVLALLAAYKDVPEETARTLLSNDLLLDQLQHMPDEKAFKEAVEFALVRENRLLIAERDRLSKVVKSSTRKSDEIEKRLEGERELRKRAEQRSERLKDLETKAQKLGDMRRMAEARAQLAERKLSRSRDLLALLFSASCGAAVFWGLSFVRYFEGHDRSLSIRALSGLFVLLALMGAVRPRLRKVLWWGSGGALLVLIIIASLL